MCTAADVTIVEVEELVESGALDPDSIHVPGIYVDRIIIGGKYEKRIEVIIKHGYKYLIFRTRMLVFRIMNYVQKTKILKKDSGNTLNSTPAALLRERIARRAAIEFQDGMYGILSSLDLHLDLSIL